MSSQEFQTATIAQHVASRADERGAAGPPGSSAAGPTQRNFTTSINQGFST